MLDEKKVKKVDDLSEAFGSVESANEMVKLKAFNKFEDTTEALASATAMVESKLDGGLKKFLKKYIVKKGLTVRRNRLRPHPSHGPPVSSACCLL